MFTFKNGEPQESYFIKADNIDVCLYKDGAVPIEKLLNEVKEIYKIRTKSV